jgi:LppX_LprAFG lipoprotein
MNSIKRFPVFFLGLALAMMIMSACGQSTASSSLTPLQVLQNSANAMKNMKTAHVDLNVTSQISGANATGLETVSNIDVRVQGSGDQSVADKQQKMDLTLGLDGLPIQVSEVMTNDRVYIKNPQGQWYFFDKKTTSQQSGCSFDSLFALKMMDESSLLGLLEHITVNDHGDENLNGQLLRHITANMDKATLKQLVSDNPQLKCVVGSQDMNTVKNFSSSVDVYIDEKQFYVRRSELKVNMGMDDNGKTTSTNSDLIVDLSNFNQPVTITVPANATLLTDHRQLLGRLGGLLK